MGEMQKDYYGVFGPGDGKPVAVFDDADIAARERRKRFGDGGFTAPVQLGEKESAAIKAAQDASTVEAGPPDPLINDGMAAMRSRARAEVHNEELMKALKEEVRADVRAEIKRQIDTGTTELQEAADKRTAAHTEAVVASHASVTEAATGSEPPAGELPVSPMHSVGPAPGAQGIESSGVRAPELPDPAAPAVHNPNAATPATPAEPASSSDTGKATPAKPAQPSSRSGGGNRGGGGDRGRSTR